MSGYVTVRREGLSAAPTTPPECVNEKERGQEESTTEVLTEGNEGLRLHLFWPSTPSQQGPAVLSAFSWHL